MTTYQRPSRGLAPSFYDWFPVFDEAELRDRRTEFGNLSLTTLLTTQNLFNFSGIFSDGVQTIRALLRASTAQKRDALAQSLLTSGITEASAAAIATVERHRFVRPQFELGAYLNVSIPTLTGSWLSMPGIVGMMLDAVATESFDRFVEFGSGCGAHLATAKQMFGNRVQYIGLEIDAEAYLIGKDNLSEVRANVKTINAGAEEFDDWTPRDCYTATFTLSEECLAFVFASMTDQSVLVTPVRLSVAEFRLLSELRRSQFSDYEAYRAQPTIVKIAKYRKIGNLIAAQSMFYDVRFVFDRNSAGNNGRIDVKSSELVWLLDLMKQG